MAKTLLSDRHLALLSAAKDLRKFHESLRELVQRSDYRNPRHTQEIYEKIIMGIDPNTLATIISEENHWTDAQIRKLHTQRNTQAAFRARQQQAPTTYIDPENLRRTPEAQAALIAAQEAEARARALASQLNPNNTPKLNPSIDGEDATLSPGDLF